MKSHSVNLIYFLLCLFLSTIVFLIFRSTKSDSQAVVESITQKQNVFSSSNFTIVKVDSFAELTRLAYHNFAKIKKTANELNIALVGANQMIYRFYNGNDNLLKFGLSDFGFEIKMNMKEQALNARFEIDKDCVHVPNDVLINVVKLFIDAKPKP
jgi:hypothetical protein